MGRHCHCWLLWVNSWIISHRAGLAGNMEHAGHCGDAAYCYASWHLQVSLMFLSRMSLSDSLCHLILFQTDCMTLCEVICITKYCHDQISSPHYPIENNLSSEVSFCSGSSACCVHSGLRWAGRWWCWAGINHAQAALHQHGHQPATQYSGTAGLWSCICDQISHLLNVCVCDPISCLFNVS